MRKVTPGDVLQARQKGLRPLALGEIDVTSIPYSVQSPREQGTGGRALRWAGSGAGKPVRQLRRLTAFKSQELVKQLGRRTGSWGREAAVRPPNEPSSECQVSPVARLLPNSCPQRLQASRHPQRSSLNTGGSGVLRSRDLLKPRVTTMQQYQVHFAKGALPPRVPAEGYFMDPELGYQRGSRHQWHHDSAAPQAHRPSQLTPQARWQLAYHGPRGGNGGWRWWPRPLVPQQPQPSPPSPLRQRLCPIHGARRGLPAAASVPQPPPAPITSPTTSPTSAPAMVSSGPAPPAAAGILLEPSQPTEARPLPAPAACGPFTSYSSDIMTEDDVYCSCLAKTLCHVPVPVTVGFYAPFGCRLHMMLDKITSLMQQEATQREFEELQRVRWRPRQVSGWGFPQLLWYLVFLQPLITEVHLRRKNVQFLFIRFSAWQYAGTDKLWAGLVTTLCEGIRHHYGALPFSVYSVLGNKPATSPDFCQREWHCRRRVCLALVALLAALCLGVGLLYLSLGGHAPGHAGASGSLLKVFGGAATTLSGSGLLMAVYSVGKHLFVSQRKKIERLVSREKFGSQLGFMCEVKKEVELLTDFLCFLEIYQRRRLRVVLEVTGLDTCYPERVVGVLNAINTLLSDSHAPFIFILVVDPSILAACLENAGNMKGTADNGYLFLNRTVTLPFSVPIMGRRTKLQFLHDAVQSRDDLLYREITRKLRLPGAAQSGVDGAEGAQLLAVEMQAGAERAQSRIDAEAARRIQEALLCLHDERDCLYEFVPDNVVSMRRIVNTVPITVRLLQQQQLQGDFGGPTPRQAVAWVVLANQWPCRLSWVLQCLEDRQQVGGAPEGRARLWDVFCDNSRELHTMTKELQNVLDLDGDPELFERFLGADFPFTVAEAQSLLRCTVNLDHSIRRRMGLIRAVRTLKPPSPPRSPARDTAHATNGAANRATTAAGVPPSGHTNRANHTSASPPPGHNAGHASGHASNTRSPQDCAKGGKSRPLA
ncbi:PREDICTED: NTPase KAP family P-loop domain-containing protein 1 [Chrysochloris asiatica]|uniref:NTPase KAP family P-loop domain-containing protein 1 n=1 Tax=Chrysochloris asiatica TaxID=185453 RepID=A0A9B0U2Q8_CHRAS|nr:PREDICTED: NTPase KAP family P-loop domain-containing protein 1 [Chrysochloris asiatica]